MLGNQVEYEKLSIKESVHLSQGWVVAELSLYCHTEQCPRGTEDLAPPAHQFTLGLIGTSGLLCLLVSSYELPHLLICGYVCTNQTTNLRKSV